MDDTNAARKGKVSLIGAGPGDPLLLTLRGARAIAEADVLVHDRLAHPKLLEHAKRSAELIYVGKTPEHHTMKQDEINRLLVDLALAGKKVARVKGGDPFVFGRGGEEAEALAKAGVEFDVVPGVSSAIGVPAYAGIPVTHRGVATSLGIVTGHEDPSKGESSVRWEHLARGLDTLVFLMGVGNLPEIASKLIENGRAPETPAAVIEWGTRAEQRTVTATLATIAAAADQEGISAPAVTVVGDVVGLREQLAWFDRRPLFGQTIVVTRAREQASELSSRLSDLGANVVEFPVISCRPLEDTSELDAAIITLGDYDWIVFTSVNGVEFFVRRLFEMGADVRALGGVSIACMGEATQRAVESHSLRVDFTPGRFVAEAFVEEFPDIEPDTRILVARALEAREVIPDELRKLGATVTVAPCYRTVISSADGADLRLMLASGQVDVVTFTSSSTVRNFAQLLGDDEEFSALLDQAKIASIGPITSETAAELGMRVDVEAEVYTIPGLVDAILRHAQGS